MPKGANSKVYIRGQKAIEYGSNKNPDPKHCLNLSCFMDCWLTLFVDSCLHIVFLGLHNSHCCFSLTAHCVWLITLRARFLCMHTVFFVDCPLCVFNFVCIENVCRFNFNLVSDSQGRPDQTKRWIHWWSQKNTGKNTPVQCFGSVFVSYGSGSSLIYEIQWVD